MRALCIVFLLVSGCAVVGAPSPVRVEPTTAEQVKRVVVYEVEDSASVLTPEERKQLSAVLRARLDQRSGFQIVLDQDARAQLAAEKRAALAQTRDERTSVELGRVASATHAVRTALLRLGDGCTLTAALYDLSTEARIASHTENVACDLAAQRAGVERLAATLGVGVTPDGRWFVASQSVTGTDRYSLMLVLDGLALVGTNPKGDRWEGRLDGRTFVATWRRNGFAGRLRGTFSEDGKRLVGKYGLGDGSLDWNFEATREK